MEHDSDTTNAQVLAYYRELKRAWKSLYGFQLHLEALDQRQLFLFTGWLRVAERAQRGIVLSRTGFLSASYLPAPGDSVPTPETPNR